MTDKRSSEIVVLGAANNPPIELVDMRTGERLSLPIGARWGAFDHALPRQGWTAVQIGYEVLAIPDGNVLAPRSLPAAWQVVPASDPGLAAMTLYEARSVSDDEARPVLLVNADGDVVQSSNIALQALRGQLEDGTFIASDGRWSASGEKLSGLPEGIPLGVVCARTVVIWQPAVAGRGETPSTVVAFDSVTGESDSIEVPFKYDPMSPHYNSDATSLAVLEHDAPGVLIVRRTEPPRWFEVPLGSSGAAWIDHDQLLFVHDKHAYAMDAASGEIETVGPPLKYVCPMAVMTDRLDLDDVRSRLVRPPEMAMTPSRRKAMLSAEQERLTAGAELVGLDTAYVGAALPAVRLRTWPPEAKALGRSRFGGRPDFAPGERWPVVAGKPLAFLGQLDLAQVWACQPGSGLPRAGLLRVFALIEPDGMYPPDDDDVLASVAPPSEWKRASWPRSLPEELRFDPADVSLTPMLSLPPWGHPIHEAQPDDEMDRFDDEVGFSYASHRMFGFPDAIQEWEPTPGRVLLFQLDGDALMQTMWGDNGQLRVWAPATAAGRVKVASDGTIANCTIDLDCM